MPDFLLFGLLFVALVLGFVMGRWQSNATVKPSRQSLGWTQRSYYQGLNQLLNDEPDAAVDTFITALEVNSETLETHLALGSLLRKRGESTRAIRVHQNLLARPSLSRAQLQLAQLELGIDFLKSGLLDRAESLFKELANAKTTDKKIREQALAYLVEVYRDTSDWLDAIDVADRLTSRKFGAMPDKWREMQAHFSCELAEQAMSKNNVLEARRLLRNAQRFDKHCARALLLQAQVEINDGAPTPALALLKRIPYQSPQFISEALPLMKACFATLASQRDFKTLLEEIYKAQPHLLTLRYLVEELEEHEGAHSAITRLQQELPQFPKLTIAAELLKLVTEQPTSEQLDYARIKPVLTRLLTQYAHYVCVHCGFTAQKNHWLCPSCRNWGGMVLD